MAKGQKSNGNGEGTEIEREGKREGKRERGVRRERDGVGGREDCMRENDSFDETIDEVSALKEEEGEREEEKERKEEWMSVEREGERVREREEERGRRELDRE